MPSSRPTAPVRATGARRSCLRGTLLPALLLLTLAACGGGTSGSGDNGGSPGDGNDDGTNGTTGFSYRSLTPAADTDSFATQTAAQGSAGYRYSSNLVFGTTEREIHIRNNDAPASFEYRFQVPATTSAALVEQANTQGALGYRFRGNLAFSVSGDTQITAVYVRDSGVAADYVYEALSSTHTVAERQAQLDAQAARGYRYVSDFVIGTEESFSLYARDQSRSETYAYKLLEPATTQTDLATQLNTEGAANYRYRGSIYLSGDDQIRTIFVSRTSAPGTYAYQLLPAQTSAAAFLEQANTQGANGLLRQGDLSVGGSTVSLFVDPADCNCRPLRLADPFID